MDKFDDAKELNSVRFMSADTEAAPLTRRTSSQLSRISSTEKYTQNDVELSVLTSIHVNPLGYVLGERKQLGE